MSDKAKTKQVVINVSDESKAKITELKKTLKVSDKEFIAAVLVVLGQTAESVITAAVEQVTVEKAKARIEARIAKIQAQLEAAKAEVVDTETVATAE